MNTIKTTPKDFFLHLGATIALYVVAYFLIDLTFSTINYAFPDVLAGYFYSGSLNWPISTLIVLVPTLYVLEWLINRDLTKSPEKKDLWIRRWRIYLTLFLTSITILGTVITLLTTFLSGEITTRFIYKVIVILVISGIIFGYYLLDKMANSKKNTKISLAGLGLVAVIAAIVAGFLVVGSPTKQRDVRLDNRRTSDLSSIQWQIISHWQQKELLPASLSELNDPISNFIVPTDPKTKTSYEYRIVNANTITFELCATFAQKSEDNQGRGEYYGGKYATDVSYPSPTMPESWDHEAGRTCFERTIDPDRYAPIKRVI
ncbi:MAG: DUF5671 domain-containing protein [Candidatus Paceibacterota bacterium]